MKLEIITPESRLFNGEVSSVQVPGKKGSFTVLHNHAPIISTLAKGFIKLVSESQGTREIAIEGGVVEVKRNRIIVLADLAK